MITAHRATMHSTRCAAQVGPDLESTLEALIDSIPGLAWEPGGLNRYSESEIRDALRGEIETPLPPVGSTIIVFLHWS